MNFKVSDKTLTTEVCDDVYLNMELTLPHKEGRSSHKVSKRLRDANVLSISTANKNPLLDSRLYGVKYLDGYMASLPIHKITGNIPHKVMMNAIYYN